MTTPKKRKSHKENDCQRFTSLLDFHMNTILDLAKFVFEVLCAEGLDGKEPLPFTPNETKELREIFRLWNKKGK